MKGYLADIEAETLANTDYRRVLYTAYSSQLVLMSIEPGDTIGEETHHLDQFIRFEGGTGEVVLDGVTHPVRAGTAVVIPAETQHNVRNTGEEPLKLYTLYAPPEHRDQAVHETKADESGEHFDGVATESRL